MVLAGATVEAQHVQDEDGLPTASGARVRALPGGGADVHQICYQICYVNG